ncbi:MAG: phosphotransferase [Candidatus Poseidoniaceae archaeon]|nr:phosphotransferase [Candidatus Poseidoniaceae archaeon]
MAYTEVSLNDASIVVEAAGLSELLSIEKLAGGWANSNYILTLKDDTKLVLKIWNEQSLDEVNYLLSMTSYLFEMGVPTPPPIGFKNGKTMMVKDGLAWTLLPFVEGQWLESNHSSLYSLGVAQANLHLVKPPVELKNNFSMGDTLFEKLFSIANENHGWTGFLEMLKTESDLLNERMSKDLPSGIIHGDLFPDNVIGTKEKVKSLLDFEEMCYGVLAFDLVMTFVGFGWKNGQPVAEHWNSLLAGYQSIRKLNDDEINALPDLHRLATLSIAAWRYWQFVINFPNTEHTDRYLEMTERLDKELPF